MPSKKPSTLTFNYGKEIYDEMMAESTETLAQDLKIYGYPAQPNETVRVYRGYSTTIIRKLGFGNSTGQRVMMLLTAMRCVTLLKAGSNRTPSIYLLHYKPTDKSYDEYKKNTQQQNSLIIPSRYEILIKELTSLREICTSITNKVHDLESRVYYLESLVRGRTSEQ